MSHHVLIFKEIRHKKGRELNGYWHTIHIFSQCKMGLTFVFLALSVRCHFRKRQMQDDFAIEKRPEERAFLSKALPLRGYI